MEITGKFLSRVVKSEHIWLGLLIIFTLAVHFSIILNPAEPVFDEQHYIGNARSILNGQGDIRPEHPPLGKALVLLNMILLGDTPLGWRLFPVLFGTTSIIIFYLICRTLKMSAKESTLATFLLGLESLTFTQSSIAMLDVFSVTFMMVSFWGYLRDDYATAGVAAGLSALAKFSGVFVLVVIGLHWLLSRRNQYKQFAGLLFLVPAVFLILLPLLNIPLTGKFTNPFWTIQTMLSLNASQTFANTTHPGLSYPWQWIINFKVIDYWYTPRYIALISPTIWALIIPSVAYMLFKAIKGNKAGLFGVAWFAGTYLPWIAIILITDRISFMYYFYPTIGAICIGLGLGLGRIITALKTAPNKLRKAGIALIGVYLFAHLAIFIAFSSLISFQ